MKINLRNLLTFYISIFLCLNVVQCTTLGKLAPEYKGVNPILTPFVNEFKEIAAKQGITFKNEVSVGFKRLNGSTVGLTSYGPGNAWREIDIDPQYFDQISLTHRITLLRHELIHAYCDRGHDFGPIGIKYPEYETWKDGKEPIEGRYTDGSGCPLTIMYPAVLSDFCMTIHYNDYLTEMFLRCKPY